MAHRAEVLTGISLVRTSTAAYRHVRCGGSEGGLPDLRAVAVAHSLISRSSFHDTMTTAVIIRLTAALLSNHAKCDLSILVISRPSRHTAIIRSSAVAEGPRDASCSLKYC